MTLAHIPEVGAVRWIRSWYRRCLIVAAEGGRKRGGLTFGEAICAQSVSKSTRWLQYARTFGGTREETMFAMFVV